MDILIKVAQFLLSLSLLIILHEFGHYIAARIFKTRVEKFYLFFDAWGKKLFSFKKGETEYGIGWLPLGGYVKISGMIDESMDKEQLKQEPQPYEFRSKPAWQRLIIMLGGVTVNFILGFLIFSLILTVWGDKYISNDSLKDGVWIYDSLGEKFGIETGDKILSIDGKKIENFKEIPGDLIMGKEFAIERNGEILDKKIPSNIISELTDRKKSEMGFISPRIPFVIGKVSDSSLNKNSGLLPKDLIVGINGKKVKYFDEISKILDENKNKNIVLTVERNFTQKNINVMINDEGKIGVAMADLKESDLEKLGYLQFKTTKYSFLQSIPVANEKTVGVVTNIFKQLKMILNPNTGAYKGLGGFISIGSIFPSNWDWQAFWYITAFLSIMLGIMNLLPIPALDGGHAMFVIFEMITGKKPSDKFLEYAQIVGFVLLMALILFANGNDIFRLIKGWF